MARLRLENDTLHLQLTTPEKIAGLHGDVRVPLAAVREVAVEDDAIGAVRGLRAPGYSLPGRTKIGTWRRRGHRSFVVVRRDVPAVRVGLAGAGFDELLVSTGDAREVAGALGRAA
jgi:hypothetical protein